MTRKVVPMIHVPDVRATVDWNESIGFTAVPEQKREFFIPQAPWRG